MNVEGIIAHNKDFVIGKGDGMAWHHSGDAKRFKSITMGHNLLMGPKTFLGIARHYHKHPGAEVLPGRTIFVLGEPRVKVDTASNEVSGVHKRGYGKEWMHLVHEVISACRVLGVSYGNVRVLLRDSSPREILDRIEMNYLKNGETLLVSGGAAIYHDYLEHCSVVHQTIVDVHVPDAPDVVKLSPQTVDLLKDESENIWITENVDGEVCGGIDATYFTLRMS